MKWAAAVALAGCFGKPGFTHRDASTADEDAAVCAPTKPSAAGMMVNTDPANTVATLLDSSQIGFANVFTQYPMVDRLIAAGQNLVAAPETSCNFEDRVGVAVYPVYNIGPEPSNGTHLLDLVSVGPAFTRLRTVWTYQLPAACGSTARGTGNTEWSIFPDGKIVRNDTVVPSELSSLTAGTLGCNCSGAGAVTAFAVTSYTTLEATALSAVTLAGEAEQSSVPPNTATNVAGACARGSDGGRLAVWWDRVDNMDPKMPPTRIRHAMNPATSHDIVAFVYDFVTSGSMTSQIPAGTSYGIRTHMLLTREPVPCTTLLSTVQAFSVISPMTIAPVTGGAAQPVSYNQQGVFDDVRPFTGPVTVSGTLPPGFAVSLRFPGFTAVSTDRTAERVIWQRQMDGSFVVFFRDGLSPQSTITVTPECGA